MLDAAGVARLERARLCDALDQCGPSARTLCEGWTARDLAAHLVVRESRPDAAAGMFVGLLAEHLAAVMQRTAQLPWSELVNRVRSGPPRTSPLRYLEGLANVIEYVVHREDVLRAQGEPRQEDRSEQEMAIIWQRLRSASPLFFRGDAVTVECPGFGMWLSNRVQDESNVVHIVGSPVEVLLLATGRPHACEVTGATPAVEAFQHRRRNI